MSELDDSKAPLLDHLIELRRRLVWSILALLVTFGVSFYFVDYIFAILVHPLANAFPAGEGKLVYTKLYEAFFVEVKLSMFAGFFFAFPIIATQIWRFVAPGLYKNEKRAFLPFLMATPVLFVGGAALAYFVVMPTAFEFFLGFQGPTGGLALTALPSTDEYLSLVMQFIFAFGISFQLPILVLLLHRAGIVTYDQLVKARRYMIVVAFVIAAIFTPPDVFSQVMLAVPLILLFEGALLVIKLTGGAKPKPDDLSDKKEAEASAPTS